MAKLPEDPEARRSFEQDAKALGGPLKAIATGLALISKLQPPGGSLSTMYAIWANEIFKAADSPPPPREWSDEELPFKGFDETFKPSRRNLDAMRRDYAAIEDPGGLPVKVHVAPALIYLTWPNDQHDPSKEDSTPYHCISLHVPLPTVEK